MSEFKHTFMLVQEDTEEVTGDAKIMLSATTFLNDGGTDDLDWLVEAVHAAHRTGKPLEVTINGQTISGGFRVDRIVSERKGDA